MLKEGDIELFSNPLELRKNNDNDYYESNLSITNKSNHYIIFKIYVNQKQSHYNVNPSTSFLKPNSQLKVQVRKNITENIEENTKDKFLIRFFAINTIIESIEEAIIINKDDYQFNNLNQDILDENKLKEIEFNVDEAIPAYQNMNNNMKNQISNFERAIENFENQLQNIRVNKELKNQKDNSLNKNSNKKENTGLNKNFMILLLLISFVFGGYFAKIKNNFFPNNK